MAVATQIPMPYDSFRPGCAQAPKRRPCTPQRRRQALTTFGRIKFVRVKELNLKKEQNVEMEDTRNDSDEDRLNTAKLEFFACEEGMGPGTERPTGSGGASSRNNESADAPPRDDSKSEVKAREPDQKDERVLGKSRRTFSGFKWKGSGIRRASLGKEVEVTADDIIWGNAAAVARHDRSGREMENGITGGVSFHRLTIRQKTPAVRITQRQE